MKKVKWEEMFPDELYNAIKQEQLCYLVYGLAEPHGPYNALGLDWLKAEALAEKAAYEHGGIVAPPFCWHIQERPEFHNQWLASAGVSQPLASSIPTDLYLRMVLYQIRAVDARGFHAGVLITGHYGGVEKWLRLLCEYYTRQTSSPLQLRAFADWELIRYKDFKGDHAGMCETSQLMALRPGLTDLERTTVPEELGTRYAGTAFPDKKERVPSKEIGELITASQIAELGRLKQELIQEYEEQSNYSAPDLNETEELWQGFEQATHTYWSYTYDEYMAGNIPDFPCWEKII